MANNNGRLNAARVRADAKNVVSAATGAAVGAIGSMGGVLGADPKRSTVPANNYGKQNKAFGKAYNITSTPGSLVARGEKRVGKALGF